MSNAYQVRQPVNTLQVITQDFLDGAPFTEQLCDKIITGFSATPTDATSYKFHMEFVKQIVNKAKHIKANYNVYALETSFEFNELELALVIRLLNLAHHGQCILALNDSIVYIPKNLRAMETETLRVYVYKTIKSLKPSRFEVWKENFKERLKGKRSGWKLRKPSKLKVVFGKKSVQRSVDFEPVLSSESSFV